MSKFKPGDKVRLVKEVVFNMMIRMGTESPFVFDELDADEVYEIWIIEPHASRGVNSDHCKSCILYESCSYELVVLVGNEHFCLCADFLEKVSEN
jgi:hypothetical protein